MEIFFRRSLEEYDVPPWSWRTIQQRYYTHKPQTSQGQISISSVGYCRETLLPRHVKPQKVCAESAYALPNKTWGPLFQRNIQVQPNIHSSNRVRTLLMTALQMYKLSLQRREVTFPRSPGLEPSVGLGFCSSRNSLLMKRPTFLWGAFWNKGLPVLNPGWSWENLQLTVSLSSYWSGLKWMSVISVFQIRGDL